MSGGYYWDISVTMSTGPLVLRLFLPSQTNKYINVWGKWTSFHICPI